jgi:DNA polymerase III delta prime subunit
MVYGMLEKINEVQINSEKPFDKCKLQREPIAKMLSKLAKTISQPYVLSISSPWGTGKTTFIKMWSELLKKEHHPCIYFNAWENDFTDNPFISFVSEINSFIEKEFKEDDPVRSNFKKAKEKAGRFFKKASPLALKILTRNAIKETDDFIDLFNFSTDDENEVSNFLSKLLELEIDDYDKKKESIKGFKKYLIRFNKSLLEKDEFESPLFVFIDEIDRCRPTFALELLENIKHIFDIEEVIFILAVDRKQLSSSIKTLYGKDMDTDGYLRRFIDLEFNLPEPSFIDYSKFLYEHYKMGETHLFSDGVSDYNASKLSYFFEIFNFSLRKQNQFASRLNCILRYDLNSNINLLIFLLALKFYDEKLYYGILHRNIDKEIIIALLNKDFLFRQEYRDLDDYLLYIEVLIHVILLSHNDYNQYMENQKSRLSNEKEPDDVQTILRIAGQYEPDNFRKTKLKYIKEAIEFSGHFSNMIHEWNH